jgi:hypothetical protein
MVCPFLMGSFGGDPMSGFPNSDDGTLRLRVEEGAKLMEILRLYDECRLELDEATAVWIATVKWRLVQLDALELEDEGPQKSEVATMPSALSREH